MFADSPRFEYPESLQKYMITEREYCEQNPPLTQLCGGALLFDGESKMLLIQRSKTEKAFPNRWVGGKRGRTTSQQQLKPLGNSRRQDRRHG